MKSFQELSPEHKKQIQLKYDFFKKPEPELSLKPLILKFAFIFTCLVCMLSMHVVLYENSKDYLGITNYYQASNKELLEKLSHVDFSVSDSQIKEQFLKNLGITPDILRFNETNIRFTEMYNGHPVEVLIIPHGAKARVVWTIPSEMTSQFHQDLTTINKNDPTLIEEPILQLVDNQMQDLRFEVDLQLRPQSPALTQDEKMRKMYRQMMDDDEKLKHEKMTHHPKALPAAHPA